MALSDYFPLPHAEAGAGRLDHDPHGAQDKVGGGHQDSDLRRLCQRVRKVAAPFLFVFECAVDMSRKARKYIFTVFV
jgi:hypothetical protein